MKLLKVNQESCIFMKKSFATSTAMSTVLKYLNRVLDEGNTSLVLTRCVPVYLIIIIINIYGIQFGAF